MKRRGRRLLLGFAAFEVVYELRFLMLALMTPFAMQRRDEIAASVQAVIAEAAAERGGLPIFPQ